MGDSVLEINLLFRFEFMRVNEEPVSNNAESLKFLTVTVEMGLAGGVIVKQFDNTAQKLMTAAGKRVELCPFFLSSFPKSMGLDPLAPHLLGLGILHVRARSDTEHGMIL